MKDSKAPVCSHRFDPFCVDLILIYAAPLDTRAVLSLPKSTLNTVGGPKMVSPWVVRSAGAHPLACENEGEVSDEIKAMNAVLPKARGAVFSKAGRFPIRNHTCSTSLTDSVESVAAPPLDVLPIRRTHAARLSKSYLVKELSEDYCKPLSLSAADGCMKLVSECSPRAKFSHDSPGPGPGSYDIAHASDFVSSFRPTVGRHIRGKGIASFGSKHTCFSRKAPKNKTMPGLNDYFVSTVVVLLSFSSYTIC